VPRQTVDPNQEMIESKSVAQSHNQGYVDFEQRKIDSNVPSEKPTLQPVGQVFTQSACRSDECVVRITAVRPLSFVIGNACFTKAKPRKT